MTDAVASPATSLEAHERYPLLHGASPVHRLARLTEHLGGPEVWAKREDVNTGVGMGGNKLRKLEYLVADRKSTRLNSSHSRASRMPSSA